MGQVVRSGKQGRWAWAFRRLTLGIFEVFQRDAFLRSEEAGGGALH